MDKNLKNFAHEISTDATVILDYYQPEELEDTLFDIFNDAKLQENQLPEVLQKRAMLHQTLRTILRKLDRNPQQTQQLLKMIQNG